MTFTILLHDAIIFIFKSITQVTYCAYVITVGCMLRGVSYEIGEQVQVNCTTRCTCTTIGEFDCITQPCSYNGPKCNSWGDPHYRTFDGRLHHFQGTCEYVLTKPCNNDDFVISAKNFRCGRRNRRVSCMLFVRIRITSENLEILLQRGRARRNRGMITINGVQQPARGDGMIYESNTVDILRSGGYPRVFLKTFGLRIYWDGRARAEVTVSTLIRGQICGLYGTYNGNRNDDFTKPDGGLARSLNEFGDSWLIPDPTTPGCTQTEVKKRNALQSLNCTTDQDVIAEGQESCSFIRHGPLAFCNDVLDPADYIESCEFDYCCCNETEREDCYCDSISSYASACADAGVARSTWRSPDLCRKFEIKYCMLWYIKEIMSLASQNLIFFRL